MSDLISRQDAINTVSNWLRAVFGVNSNANTIGVFRGLRALPSAEPRMKGRWIYGESEEGHDGYFCSQCGNFVPWIYKEFDIDFIKEFKFCPSCGADMRGEEE